MKYDKEFQRQYKLFKQKVFHLLLICGLSFLAWELYKLYFLIGDK